MRQRVRWLDSKMTLAVSQIVSASDSEWVSLISGSALNSRVQVDTERRVLTGRRKESERGRRVECHDRWTHECVITTLFVFLVVRIIFLIPWR